MHCVLLPLPRKSRGLLIESLRTCLLKGVEKSSFLMHPLGQGVVLRYMWESAAHTWWDACLDRG